MNRYRILRRTWSNYSQDYIVQRRLFFIFWQYVMSGDNFITLQENVDRWESPVIRKPYVASYYRVHPPMNDFW